MTDLLMYWLYIILALLISLIPGLAIAMRLKDMSNLERLAMSFGFSYILLVILTPLFTSGYVQYARIIFVVIFIIISIYFLSKRIGSFLNTLDIKLILLILAASLAIKFALQPLWEYPLAAADWYIHTLITPLQFDSGNWMPPRDRTPLYNLVIYSFHKLLGSSFYSYWVSQLIGVVASNIFILPAYLISRKFFSEWVSRVSIIFMSIFPFIINNSMLTGPGPLDAYFMLLSIYFLFFRNGSSKDYAFAGMFAALAFLTHNSNMVFVITITLAKLLFNRKNNYRFNYKIWENVERSYIYFFLTLAISLVPYFLWVYSYYGTFMTSRFIYYPFSVTGYPLALEGTPEEVFSVFHATPWKEIIWIRISNAAATLTPIIAPVTPIPYQFRTYDPSYYHLFSLPGVLSLLMYIFAVIWFLRYITGRSRTNNVLVLIVVLPFVLNLVMFGWVTWGIIKETPSILILIMLGINELSKISNPKLRNYLISLLFIDVIVEDIIYYKLLLSSSEKVGGIVNDVTLGARQFIPDFQASEFISAHFLLNQVEFYSNLVLTVVVIAGAFLLYRRISKIYSQKSQDSF